MVGLYPLNSNTRKKGKFISLQQVNTWFFKLINHTQYTKENAFTGTFLVVKLNLAYSKVEAFSILLVTAALLFHHVNQKSKYILEKNKLYPRRQTVTCY